MASASDYSDTEDEFDPSSSRKGRKGAKYEYQVRHALKPPRSTTYNALSLYEQIVEGNIDLSPDYQRDVVWNEMKQINLIDSVFRNFYIPPLIFAVSTAADGTEKRTCIDGKQRLTSIQKFIDGLIYHRDPEHPREKWWYAKKQSSGRLLSEKYRRLFALKQIVCIEYDGLSDEDEREIFRRVQLGMALTVAEKMKADTRTERSALVHDLVSAHGGQLADAGFASKRDNPFRYTATALLTLTSGLPVTQAATNEQVKRWLQSTSALPEAFETRVRAAFELLMAVLGDKQANALQIVKGVRTLSPIDYVFMVVLVYHFMDRFGAADIATAIRKMRQAAREQFADLKWNTLTIPPYSQFLAKLETQGLAALTDEEDAMEVDELMTESPPPMQPPQSTASRSRSSTAPRPSSHPPPPSTAPPPVPAPSQPSVGRLAAIKSAKAGVLGAPPSSSQASLPPPPPSQSPVSAQPPTPTSATTAPAHPLPSRPALSISGLSNVVSAAGVPGPTRGASLSREDRFRPYPPPGEPRKAKTG